MNLNKYYLIQIQDGNQLVAKLVKKEKKFYFLKFKKCDILNYSNKIKKILISRFESGIACMEGTDYLIIKEIQE